jgi:hypothetical protein
MWRWNPIDSPPAPWVVEAGRCQKHIRVTLNGDFMRFHGILYGILWGFMLCFKFCVKLSMRIYAILLLIYPPDFSKMAIGNQQVEEVNDVNHLRMGLFCIAMFDQASRCVVGVKISACRHRPRPQYHRSDWPSPQSADPHLP